MEKKCRVLIIEDNADLAANIGEYLQMNDFEADYAPDGLTGLHLALTLECDAIVLDLNLPKIDGLTVCRRLRDDGTLDVPILMLTARDTLEDKLEGFRAGTDDYLVKPFSLAELTLRLKALIRRSQPKTEEVIRLGDLEINQGTRAVTRKKRQLRLGRSSYTILLTLARAHPKVVKRKDLEQELWGDYRPGSDSLRSHIYNLRKELSPKGEVPMIETVHAVGFRLKIQGSDNES